MGKLGISGQLALGSPKSILEGAIIFKGIFKILILYRNASTPSNLGLLELGKRESIRSLIRGCGEGQLLRTGSCPFVMSGRGFNSGHKLCAKARPRSVSLAPNQLKSSGEGIPRWRLEVGSRKRPSYSEILERRWRHTLQA
jgi:hypothetical protein